MKEGWDTGTLQMVLLSLAGCGYYRGHEPEEEGQAPI